jgi:glycosyltransferase involved in cell wall biosynthesis
MPEGASRSPGVTLFVLAMNEIDGMRAVMPRVKREWVDQIIVADGQSTDGTIEYAREHGYEVVVQGKPGGREAFKDTFPLIRHEYVITFAPNGKLDPDHIPALVARLKEGHDMVIVSRYKDGAKSHDDSIVSSFANWFFTTSINLLFGGRYTDVMGIYRGYKTELFYDLDLDKDESHLPERLFGIVLGIEPLLAIRAVKRRLDVIEIAGDEGRRVGGVNKFPKVSGGLGYFLQMVRELWFWKER